MSTIVPVGPPIVGAGGGVVSTVNEAVFTAEALLTASRAMTLKVWRRRLAQGRLLR